MSSGRVHVVGHLGGRNYGDDLMFEGVRTLLAEVDGDAELVPWQLAQLGRFTRAARRERASLLLLPGSSFHDYYRSARILRQDAAKAAYAAFALVARSAGWDVTYWGSLGPSWRRPSQILDATVARSCSTLLLRDRASLRHLERLGVSVRAELAPDPALPVLEREIALADLACTEPDAGSVLVCPTVDRQFPEWTYPVPDPTVAALARLGFARIVVAASHAASATDVDHRAVDQLGRAAARYGVAFDTVALEVGRGQDVASAWVRELAGHGLVVSSRLHPAMTGLALGRPTVVAPYHPKLGDVLSTHFEDVSYLPPNGDVTEVVATLRAAVDRPARPAAGRPRGVGSWSTSLVGR